ncbi:VWA domain-containing protein [Actinoplanes subglobosus]|uniref:VWA domain-containing protein n=1 Tax=Actinoplanes subglobosus TaxID=1547892 RepID=A0ABV8IPK3_9ACTN
MSTEDSQGAGDPQKVAAQIHDAVVDAINIWWRARRGQTPRGDHGGTGLLPRGSVSALSRALSMPGDTLDRKLKETQRYEWSDIVRIVSCCVPAEEEQRLARLAGLWQAWKNDLQRPPGYWGRIERLDGQSIPAELSPEEQLQEHISELRKQFNDRSTRLGHMTDRLTKTRQALDLLNTKLRQRKEQVLDLDQKRLYLTSQLNEKIELLLEAQQQADEERERADQADARADEAKLAAADEATARHEAEDVLRYHEKQAAAERERADQAEKRVAELAAEVERLSERLAAYETYQTVTVQPIPEPRVPIETFNPGGSLEDLAVPDEVTARREAEEVPPLYEKLTAVERSRTEQSEAEEPTRQPTRREASVLVVPGAPVPPEHPRPPAPSGERAEDHSVFVQPARGGRRWLLVIPVVLIVAVVAVVKWIFGPGEDPGLPGSDVAAYVPLKQCDGRQTQKLQIRASQEKEGLLRAFAKEYGPREAGAGCYQVEVVTGNSGRIKDLMIRKGAKVAAEILDFDVWSPASSVWYAMTGYWAGRKNSMVEELPAQPGAADMLFTSPVVIAVPQSAYATLNSSNNGTITWDALADYARASNPMLSFNLGLTNPNYSSSGLAAAVAAFSAFAGGAAGSGLVVDAVNRPDVQEKVRSIEKAVVHNGEQTLKLLAGLREAIDRGEKNYLSAVAVEEVSMIAFNNGWPCGAVDSSDPACEQKPPPADADKLVPLYIATGTLFSDHPYLKMPGLSEEKIAVADNFLAFVRSPSSQQAAREAGFRSYDNQLPLASALPGGHELLRDVPKLAKPDPGAVDMILQKWPDIRKPLNAVIAIDTSGSMGDPSGVGNKTKMKLINEAAPTIVDGTDEVPTFGERDRVGLWSFSAGHHARVRRATCDEQQKNELRNQIAGLEAEENVPTDLYTAVKEAVADLRADYDPAAINAVILLTDGDDTVNSTNNRTKFDEMFELIKSDSGGERPVAVFSIAYGDDADPTIKNKGKPDSTVLTDISGAAGGSTRKAEDFEAITEVFLEAVSNF